MAALVAVDFCLSLEMNFTYDLVRLTTKFVEPLISYFQKNIKLNDLMNIEISHGPARISSPAPPQFSAEWVWNCYRRWAGSLEKDWDATRKAHWNRWPWTSKRTRKGSCPGRKSPPNPTPTQSSWCKSSRASIPSPFCTNCAQNGAGSHRCLNRCSTLDRITRNIFCSKWTSMASSTGRVWRLQPRKKPKLSLQPFVYNLWATYRESLPAHGDQGTFQHRLTVRLPGFF